MIRLKTILSKMLAGYHQDVSRFLATSRDNASPALAHEPPSAGAYNAQRLPA
jgi:hypothetical protein